MNKILRLILITLFFSNIGFAETKNPVKEIEKQINELEGQVEGVLKAITGKSLNKKQTKKFLSQYVITLEDERGDGKVTYLFKDKNYIRYKDFKEISSGAWRFTNAGRLRVFNADIKLTWKIILGKENNINIKPKYDLVGKLYNFEYQLKEDFLLDLENFNKKIEEEKKRLEQEKLDAQKKAEQEKLDAQKKAEEEKKRLKKKA